MKCSDYQNQIQSDVTRVDHDEALHQHVASCSQCRSVWKDTVLTQQLQQMAPVPQMSADFVQRLQQKVEEKSQQQRIAESDTATVQARHKSPWMAYSSIAAIFLLIGLLLQPLTGSLNSKTPFAQQMTQVSVLPKQYETVNVLLNSAQEYKQAELSISVSGAVRFDPNDTVQTVSWQTGLKQGKNVLPVPVYLLNEQGGKLIIKMKTATGFKQMEINVNAMAAPAQEATYL